MQIITHSKRFILKIASVILISWCVISGYSYYQQNKDSELFFRLFPSWFHDRLLCSPNLTNDRELLSILSPNLVDQIDRKNADFHQLSIMDLNGEMSVADLLTYQRDDWRVEMEDEGRAVGTCRVEGLIFSEITRALEYCENYVGLTLLSQDRLGPMFGTGQAKLLFEAFHMNLQNSSRLSKFAGNMEISLSNKRRHFQQSTSKFGELPASQFAGYSKKDLRLARKEYEMNMYLEDLCAGKLAPGT